VINEQSKAVEEEEGKKNPNNSIRFKDDRYGGTDGEEENCDGISTFNPMTIL
jgi:hypothetical protein